MRKINLSATIVAIAAIVAAPLAMGIASADVPGASPASNVVSIPLTRIVDTPGDKLTPTVSTVVVPVAGIKGIPANATAVTGRLVAYNTGAGENLVVWDGVSGAPGDPTVFSGPTTVTHPSGESSSFNSALHNGSLSVHLLSGSGSFLLEITEYSVPVAPPAPGPATATATR